jgi:RNA-directed DNA polymerase
MKIEPTTEANGGELTIREALLPRKLQEWRAKLSAKAKQEKRYRFYSLYGLVSHPETVRAAWAQVRANQGGAGVDGVTIAKIEQEGEDAFLGEIAEELKAKSYRSGAVRRVYIPKANGKLRPLGIPNVKDRVVQAAVLLILEPIFEADFLDCSHGFRPQRNAHQALEKIRRYLAGGRSSVYDADLEGYFDSIPHEQLIQCVRARVVDGGVLGLIRQWLEAPVEEDDGSGGKRRRRSQCGTPQGGVISPLLANIYLHGFDRVFHAANGPVRWAKAVLVRYADDFVVLARETGAELKEFIEEQIEGRLGLKINREKTRVVELREAKTTLEFLGYSFRLAHDQFGRKLRYWSMQPSAQALARERDKLRALINHRRSHQPLPELIGQVNRHLRGWANYFGHGQSRKALREINTQVRKRLARHLRRRSQRGWRPPKGTSIYAHLQHLGLVYL